MKWFPVALIALGLALVAWGVSITNGPGSADERMAGAFPVLFGIGFIVLAAVIAFAWVVIRA